MARRRHDSKILDKSRPVQTSVQNHKLPQV